MFWDKIENTVTEVKWYVPIELSNSSYIYTSLIEFCEAQDIPFKISAQNLNKRGIIRIENDSLIHSNHFNNNVTWTQISFSNENDKLIVFDLNDNPNIFGLHALEIADIYYKRCYQDKIINALPKEFSSKIRPLGLPFMVRPNRFRYLNRMKFIFYFFKIIEILKFDRLIFQRFKLFNKKAIKHFKLFVNTRTVLDFNSFNCAVLGNVFYQKRLFDERSEDVIALNKQRVRIVKLLKNNFPDNFFGGLQKNEISELKYSEIISNIDGSQHAFLEAMRKCGICIYTNGLMGSPGWTLSEFLSQGKCIVAQNLENKLPHPLINNKHLVYYSNESELIALCNELINNAEKRHFLGENARKYYEEHIDPAVFMKKLLMTNYE